MPERKIINKKLNKRFASRNRRRFPKRKRQTKPNLGLVKKYNEWTQKRNEAFMSAYANMFPEGDSNSIGFNKEKNINGHPIAIPNFNEWSQNFWKQYDIQNPSPPKPPSPKPTDFPNVKRPGYSGKPGLPDKYLPVEPRPYPKQPEQQYDGYLGYINGKIQKFPTEQDAITAGATGIEPNFKHQQPVQPSGENDLRKLFNNPKAKIVGEEGDFVKQFNDPKVKVPPVRQIGLPEKPTGQMEQFKKYYQPQRQIGTLPPKINPVNRPQIGSPTFPVAKQERYPMASTDFLRKDVQRRRKEKSILTPSGMGTSSAQLRGNFISPKKF